MAKETKKEVCKRLAAVQLDQVDDTVGDILYDLAMKQRVSLVIDPDTHTAIGVFDGKPETRIGYPLREIRVETTDGSEVSSRKFPLFFEDSSK